MSDLLERAQKTKTLVSDPSLPKWQRLLQGLQAYSGLELTVIPDDVRERLEADFVRVNRVLEQYSLETDEDYRSMSDVGLQQAINIIDEAFSLPGELPYDLFGEAMTSMFSRILAQFSGDRPEVIAFSRRQGRLIFPS